MKKSEVRHDLKEATRELLSVISYFPEDQFNTTLPEGGWSAGEIAEHLIKVEAGTVRIFDTQTASAERDPQSKIVTIKRRMLDYDTKMEAPSQINPDAIAKDKSKVLEKLQDLRQRLTSFIEIHVLTQIIASYDHPVFGPLTRIEWIYFNIYHGKRHTDQIRQVAKQFFA